MPPKRATTSKAMMVNEGSTSQVVSKNEERRTRRLTSRMIEEVEEMQEKESSLKDLLRRMNELEKHNQMLMAENKLIREEKEKRAEDAMYEKDDEESSSGIPIVRKSHLKERKRNDPPWVRRQLRVHDSRMAEGGYRSDTGKVFTCGDGTFGQLGHGHFQSQCLPIEVMYFRKAANGRSPMIKQLWDAAIVGTIVTLWRHRNTIYHDDNRHNNLSRCTSMIRREIRATAVLIIGHSFNSIADLQILKTWKFNAILPRAPRIRPCWWTPPRNGNSGDALYGFGSGKRGQLGTSMDMISKSLNLPQVIFGFQQVSIARIIANGDQSAALTVSSSCRCGVNYLSTTLTIELLSDFKPTVSDCPPTELLGAIDNKPNIFSYVELRTATEDFSPTNNLGEGGFGPVYKDFTG
ncbi:hypothetical protein IFM89_021138 [Coptis chinensis]|uniref:Uncharacterized protein n=1 Tax=Coptis chinensis TaxID=261450 RepID=A0A835I1Z9_9MAGN|nr:hypothetical protein IFM89_021138 [Coptis chinensis]